MLLSETIPAHYSVTVAECLNQLILSSNLDQALQSIENKVAIAAGADCCSVVQRKENGSIHIKHCWSNKPLATASITEALQLKDVQGCAEFHGIFHESNFFITSSKDHCSKGMQKLMEHANLKSTAITAIASSGEAWGFLFLGSNSEKKWDDGLDASLQTICNAIGTMAASQQVLDQLYHRNEVYETTLATLNELIWEMDLRKKSIRVMGFAPRIGTFDSQEFNFDCIEYLLSTAHPDDADRVVKHFEEFLQKGNNAMSEDVYRMMGADGNEFVWVQTRRTLLCDEFGKPAIVVGTTADITDHHLVEVELQKHKEQNEFLVQQLQESNEKLNTILNSSKEIILTIDLQTGQIENVNDAIGILGYTPEEWIGQYYTQWTLEKRRRFYDLLKHASESETMVRSQQIFFATKNSNENIPFEFSTSLFHFKNKKYLLCVLRDIRERLDYEKNLTKVTEQLSHLINNIDDVYAIYNLKENKYEFVSDNLEGFFGCSKEKFMEHGLFWREIMHVEDGTGIVKQMEEVINNKSRGEFFYRITTPVGETKMLLEKITVSLDDEGEGDKVYIVKSDYTHIENAEQSLIESERKFRFISENISDFISIIDNDGKFVYASPSAQNVVGYDPDELIDQNSIYIIHPDDVQLFIEEALEKAVFHKKESQIRYRLLSKTGEYRWVETYYKPILDGMGNTTSIICSTRDVTEREQLMKDLEQALIKERELNELRSQFVSTASHQFRTPLTVIHSGVELMEIYLEGVPEAKQKPFKKQFNRIQGEVVRLQDLMNDILLLGRADASRTPFNPIKADLVAFCEELIESKYNNRYPEGRKVELSSSGKVQDVYFDPKLLDHALENILSNAYKYSSIGDIDMHLKFDYESVSISITDQGIGIPESDLGNLFQPFYRAGNTTEIEGTGLGLSIVKEFIDKHGGQIFVMSELNKGTTVNVILPLRAANLKP
jgi:PAS domain S-box-containing protein